MELMQLFLYNEKKNGRKNKFLTIIGIFAPFLINFMESVTITVNYDPLNYIVDRFIFPYSYHVWYRFFFFFFGQVFKIEILTD